MNYHGQETRAVVDLFARWGVAVFPGPFGKKGSRLKGWPTIDHEAARELTLHELDEHPINIVLRTGPELGAIDLDGKDGIDPAAALERLLAILPEGVAVYRTSRGYHVLFKPKRVVGNGLLPAYGGELFTAAHLVNIPPSRHPSGVDYEWVTPPGGQLPTVDLEALGLLPVGTAADATTNRRKTGGLVPASEQDQVEFQRLMAKAGIAPRRRAQELHHCPWHHDPSASLSVNWDAAVFNDFGGCAQGGIAELRRIVGGVQGHTA